MNASAYTRAEWRHGIWIGDRFGAAGTRDITISGLRVESTGGDGVYVSSVSDVALVGIDSTDNYRVSC